MLSKTDLKFKNIIFMIIQYSLLFNGYTLGVPRYLVYNGMHIIDTYLVYILPFIPSAMGVFLMKQYMDGYVPDAIIEAARIDGRRLVAHLLDDRFSGGASLRTDAGAVLLPGYLGDHPRRYDLQ